MRKLMLLCLMVTATQYSAISVVGIEVLAGSPTPLTGATINVIVIE